MDFHARISQYLGKYCFMLAFLILRLRHILVFNCSAVNLRGTLVLLSTQQLSAEHPSASKQLLQ